MTLAQYAMGIDGFALATLIAPMKRMNNANGKKNRGGSKGAIFESCGGPPVFGQHRVFDGIRKRLSKVNIPSRKRLVRTCGD